MPYKLNCHKKSVINTFVLCIQGRFYFGELLEDFYGCDENTSAVS